MHIRQWAVIAPRAGSSAPCGERPCSSGGRDEEAELGGVCAPEPTRETRDTWLRQGLGHIPPRVLEGPYSPQLQCGMCYQ